MKRHWSVALFGLAVSLGVAPSRAEVGDEVAVISPQPPGSETFFAFGVAFDGTTLYVNRCGDHKVYRIDPSSGNLLAEFELTDAIPERPAGMVYDGKRNGLWIGTHLPKARVRVLAYIILVFPALGAICSPFV